jgi:hypothetical protein
VICPPNRLKYSRIFDIIKQIKSLNEAKENKSVTKKYSTQYPEAPPDWYWTRGLHDAGIIQVEAFDFPFDYNKFAGQKNKNNRNLLKLKVDSKGAICDTSVKEIYFYNYKILTPDISLENRKIIWWLSDRLSEVDGGFVLEIDLQDFDSYPEDFTFKIKFERADVIR